MVASKAKKVVVQRSSDGKYHCPEAGCSEAFDHATGLGSHRYAKHGTAGATNKYYQTKLLKKEAAEGKPKHAGRPKGIKSPIVHCPAVGCTVTFKGKRWLTKHINTRHPELKEASTVALTVKPKGSHNGNKTASHSQFEEVVTRTIPPEIITYAVGEIAQLCKGLAHQNDLPARDFTRRCAIYFHAAAGR
jgi:hypothetical protein